MARAAAPRSQIRGLIESRDRDHHEITDAWIEQWAADIYRAASEK